MSDLRLPEEDELGGVHHPDLRTYGDGYTTPRERSVTCSCGEFEWTWEQHYDERDDLDEAWEKHLRDHTAEAREKEQDALRRAIADRLIKAAVLIARGDYDEVLDAYTTPLPGYQGAIDFRDLIPERKRVGDTPVLLDEAIAVVADVDY